MTPLAVACEIKALRIFDLSIADDPAIDLGRIKLTVRGMNSLKRGRSWRIGWFSEWVWAPIAAMILGTHRFQRAVSGKDVLAGIRLLGSLLTRVE
jgi:hypothetical protein